MKIAIAVAVGVLAFAASEGFGQSTSSGNIGSNGQSSLALKFTPPRFPMPVIAGAPYSADQIFEQTQTLNDGTRVSQPAPTIHMYRDSAGRTRSGIQYLR